MKINFITASNPTLITMTRTFTLGESAITTLTIRMRQIVDYKPLLSMVFAMAVIPFLKVWLGSTFVAVVAFLVAGVVRVAMMTAQCLLV